MPDSLMTDLRSQIEPLIPARGQSELARRTGIPQPSISAWLRGARSMSLERQIRIAEALGCRVTLTVTPPRKKNRDRA